MHRRGGHADATQPEIVAALRGAGCSVEILSAVGYGVPDLLVFSPYRRELLLIEVKSPGGGLEESQVSWIASWLGPVYIARSAAEALRIAGVTNDDCPRALSAAEELAPATALARARQELLRPARRRR